MGGIGVAWGRAQILSFATSGVLALSLLGGLAGAGRPAAGTALAAGLLLGTLNGPLARRALNSGLGFSVTSLARLALLSALGLACGLALGWNVAWLVPVGLGLAQLVLAGSSAVELVRQ